MEFELTMPDPDGIIKKIAANYQSVAVGSLRKVAEQVRTQAKREITARYKIHSSLIKDNIKINLHPSRLEADIVLKSRLLEAIEFSPRASNRRGVSVEIIRGQRRYPKSWFIQQMASGHINIFRRTGKFAIMSKGSYAGKRREVIQIVHTISASQMLAARPVFEKLEKFFREKLPEVLKHELDYYVSQMKAN